MKALITGGAGFIGLKLAKVLIDQGNDVVLIDTLSPQIHGHNPAIDIPIGAEFRRLDIRDTSALADIVKDCNVVYHLAAETGTGQSMYQIKNYVSVNDLGTASLLEAMATTRSVRRRLVVASSRSVYGEGAYTEKNEPGKIVSVPSRSADQLASGGWEPSLSDGRNLMAVATAEDFPFEPASVYAATKASQELLCRSAASSVNAEVTILRFQNVYGEGQSLQNPYTGIISIFFNQARQGKQISLYEDGLESRDFIHVDDVVACLNNAGSAELTHDTVINVGSGKATTVGELAGTLLKAAGYNVAVKVTGEYRVGDIRHCFADITRMESELGVVPSVSLEEGLTRFCGWAKEQEEYEDKSAAAKSELLSRGLAS